MIFKVMFNLRLNNRGWRDASTVKKEHWFLF